jgi:WD40 repeat protein
MSTVTAINPFPGLRPFREDEQHLFFGRENQVDAMVDKLATTRFLAVVGTSGSGKSSLVNCGLRPALHGGLMANAGTSWRMAQFRPGTDPVRAMARALAIDGVLFNDYPPAVLTLAEIVETTLQMSKIGLIDIYEQAHLDEGINLLVVVDQFEELFRYRQLESGTYDNTHGVSEAAAAFTNLLLEAKGQTQCPIYIVLTMRSDFLGDCTQLPGLAEAINAGQYLVPRMTRDERREAIARPVAVGGAEISPVLLTRLVNDVGDNPDQLSILQHALNRTWARWQHEGGGAGQLDLRHYEAIGTMASALDQHAEKAFAELETTRQRLICERLFKALTDKATDARGVRRPTAMGTLCALADAAAEEVAAVIEVFRKSSRSFLMPPAGEALEMDTVIDISHESLMRVWERLKRWGDEEAQSVQMYRRLADAAARHAVGKGGLWRNPDLQLALDWRNTSQPNGTWASRYGRGFDDVAAFLQQSETAQAAEIEKELERERAEAERAARDRELEQARVVADVQRQRADDQAAARVRQGRLMWGLAVVASLALGFAVFGWHQKRLAQEQTRFARTQQGIAEQQTEFAKTQQGIAEQQTKIAKTQQGIAEQQTKIAEDRLTELDIQRARAEASATHAKAEANVARSSAVAARAESQLTHDPELSLLLALESSRIAPTLQSTNALRMALSTFRPLRTMTMDSRSDRNRIHRVAYSPNGKWIAGASENGTVRVWDAQTGKFVRDLKGHTKPVHLVVFSRDSRYLATEASDTTGKVWTLESDTAMFTMEGLTGSYPALAFSPDGTRIAAEAGETQAAVWDVATKRRIFDIDHKEEIRAVLFSPDGRLLVTASDDGTAKVSDAFDGKPVAVLDGHKRAVVAAAFSDDGNRIVTASLDGTAQIFTTTTGRWGDTPTRKVITHGENAIYDVRMSPGAGDRLVTASADRTARIWNAEGRLLEVLTGHSVAVTSVRFSPDGKFVVTASETDTRSTSRSAGVGDRDRVVGDDSARLWSVASGRQVAEFRAGVMTDVAFSPDGRHVATGERDGTVRIWATMDGVDLGPRNGASARFSPDGAHVITPGPDENSVLIKDLSGKQVGQLPRHSKPVRRVGLGPDHTALTTDAVGYARLWDWRTGKVLAESNEAQTDARLGRTRGLFVTVGGANNVVRVQNEKTVLDTFSHQGSVARVSMGPGGNLVTVVSDRVATLWNYAAEDSKDPKRLEHQGRIYSTDFDRTGNLIVTASADNTAQVWNRAGRPVCALTGHTDEVNRASFSPSGNMIATTSDDHTARIWTWANGLSTATCSRRKILTLVGHKGSVYDAVFSDDGRFLLTLSMDQTARVWDTLTGGAIEIFSDLGKPDLYGDSVAFSPGGTRVLATTAEDRIKLFSCELCRSVAELRSLAAARLTRELTAVQREQYLPAAGAR